MTPVFANSARVRAPERFVVRGGAWSNASLAVRYAILPDHPDGPTLIDTGYTERVTGGVTGGVTAGRRSLPLRLYARALRPRLLAVGQIGPALATLGLAPADVRRVIVTHFHADHVAGLRDLPRARFTASGAAWARLRDAPPRARLRHGVFAELLPDDFEARLDPVENRPAASTTPFGPARDLSNDGSLLAVALPGHAEGQFGLLFPGAGLLYAVDAQWCMAALEPGRAPGAPASLVAHDPAAAARTTAAVAAFREGGGEVVLCHDPAATQYDLRAEIAA